MCRTNKSKNDNKFIYKFRKVFSFHKSISKNLNGLGDDSVMTIKYLKMEVHSSSLTLYVDGASEETASVSV